MKTAATPDLNDLVDDLTIRGYALVRTAPNADALTEAATRFGAHIGATSIGIRSLEGINSPEWLSRHTEQLDDPHPLRYFALGCLEPAFTGGATCLYDGRVAARTLLETHPELASVRITYATSWRPTIATHPLIFEDPTHGPVLRFRSALDTNTVLEPPPAGMSEAVMYGLVEAAIAESITVVHRWRAGDLLIVDNRAMIHARQPFTGTRRMIRYRYDDPHFKSVIITE